MAGVDVHVLPGDFEILDQIGVDVDSRRETILTKRLEVRQQANEAELLKAIDSVGLRWVLLGRDNIDLFEGAAKRLARRHTTTKILKAH